MPIADDSKRRALRDLLAGEITEFSPRRETSLNGAYRHLLSTGGRQWRGRLCFAAALQGPHPDSPNVLQGALVVELLHLATLAHDDLIDTGTMRRGAPSVSAAHGPHAAGFAGSRVFGRAVELASELGNDALALLAEAATNMCAGGMLELRGLHDVDRTSENYFAVAEGKTASAFVLAAGLGARLAGAPDAALAAVRGFGRDLGVAYQIWDDLIDLLAGTEVSGKPRFSDVRNGVYTLPTVYAIEQSPELRELLLRRRSNIDTGRLFEILQETGAIERARAKGNELCDRANGHARSMPNCEELTLFVQEARQRHMAAIA